jgi:hypothetical protein
MNFRFSIFDFGFGKAELGMTISYLRFEISKRNGTETVKTVEIATSDCHTLLKDQAGLAKGVNEKAIR